ncbi:MAG: Rrf2 family transcriptional regulator [Hyphomonadaceae bacterium]
MRLTSKGRYAVMAMADLSAQSRAAAPRAKRPPARLMDIAARTAISLAYLEQLFARLKRAGLVEGVRGPLGGYRLTRAPEAISVAEIIAAVDEAIETNACAHGGAVGCTGRSQRCTTHDLWAALGRRIQTYLGDVTLADILDGRVDAPARAAPAPEAAA